jgi:hypothetical protein
MVQKPSFSNTSLYYLTQSPGSLENMKNIGQTIKITHLWKYETIIYPSK